MGYWDGTDVYLAEHGGKPPTCPKCGEAMFAADDHGRFMCLCNMQMLDTRTGLVSSPRPIPQVDVSGMTDEEKAQVPPINRLHALPTKAEAELFRFGPEMMDDPAYWKACAAVDKERGQSSQK